MSWLPIRLRLAGLCAVIIAVGLMPAAAGAAARPIHEGDATCRQLALTFDTEFGPAVTPPLLDVLDAEQVRATFFLVGNEVDKYADLTRRIASRHEIGNHTYSHVSMPHLTMRAMADQLQKADAAITAITGRSSQPLFRPPFGDYDERVLDALGAAGYPYLIHWSVAPDETSTVDRQVSDLLTRTFPGGIVLMHGWTSHTPAALARAIPELRRRGFQFVTVSEAIGLGRHEYDWAGTPIHVQTGDTLAKLAACYNVAAPFLAAYNDVADVSAGQMLQVPHRDEVNLRVNGERIAAEVYPRVISGRTLAQVRTVASGLDAIVTWDAAARQARIVRGGRSVVLTIDSDVAVVNGQALVMPHRAQVIANRMLAPVRFLAEHLGARVDWDGDTRTVSVQGA